MNYASLIIIIISIVIRSSAGLQLHGGEAGRDGGGHGRRPLLAVKERLPGTHSPPLLFHSYFVSLPFVNLLFISRYITVPFSAQQILALSQDQKKCNLKLVAYDRKLVTVRISFLFLCDHISSIP